MTMQAACVYAAVQWSRELGEAPRGVGHCTAGAVSCSGAAGHRNFWSPNEVSVV